MIIKDINVHKISAKIDKPFKFSQGWVYQRSSVIVEVIGEDGTSRNSDRSGRGRSL